MSVVSYGSISERMTESMKKELAREIALVILDELEANPERVSVIFRPILDGIMGIQTSKPDEPSGPMPEAKPEPASETASLAQKKPPVDLNIPEPEPEPAKKRKAVRTTDEENRRLQHRRIRKAFNQRNFLRRQQGLPSLPKPASWDTTVDGTPGQETGPEFPEGG